MSEHQNSQLSTSQDLQDTQFVGWHGVAQQMQTWPMELQHHAGRQLARHGLSHLVEVPSSDDGLPLVVEGFPKSEAISLAFKDAHKMVRAITQDVRFDKYCIDHSIDPYNTDTESYWDALEKFVLGRTASLRATGKADNLKMSALELLAATPNVLVKTNSVHNLRLTSSEPLTGEMLEKKHRDRVYLSRFNARIRQFATDFPNTSFSQLETELLTFANAADLEYSGLAKNVNGYIRDILRGTQYEMAFGQVLAAMNVNYRSATTEEDLHGVDWVIEEGTPRALYVDVKASLKKVDKYNGGHNGTPYFVQGRDIVLYPLLTDMQFHDTFYISLETANLTAEKLAPFLEQARWLGVQ